MLELIKNKQMQPGRRGFTLVELLIVMAVLVLLAAVALPSVKELLKDQKGSQAARLIQSYAESARARAIATGRPVAMVIDRMYVDGSRDLAGNDSCTRLSIGEVFPPYEGDWSSALATIITRTADAGGGPPLPRGRQYAQIQFDHAASLYSVGTGPTGMVSAGDLIQFGTSSRLYRVADSPNDADTDVITFIAGSGTTPAYLQIDFDNPPYDEDAGLLTGEATIFPSAPMTFRIYRKPSKSLAGSITFPRGICIDLASSGIGQSGIQFGTASIAAVSRLGDPERDHLPGAYGPIQIVFDPAGRVQDVFYGLTPIVGGSAGNLLARRPADSTIHLLIGKTEQVVPSPAYLGPTIVPAFDETDDVNYNLLDPANFWVSINPFTGSITTSQVQDQSAFPLLPDTMTDVQRANARVARSRALASAGFQRVGQ